MSDVAPGWPTPQFVDFSTVYRPADRVAYQPSPALTEMEIATRAFDLDLNETFWGYVIDAANSGIPSPMEVGNMTCYLWHHSIMGDMPDWQSFDSLARTIEAAPGKAKWPPRTVEAEINNINLAVHDQLVFLRVLEEPYSYSRHFEGLGK